MTIEVLSELLDSHQYIEWCLADDGILFRNMTLPWYQNDESRATKITTKKLIELDVKDFFDAINYGLEISQIARITGYFAKVESFNKGKRAELRDRYKNEIL